MARCIYPITLGDKEGLKKHKVVPCGKCVPCKRRRQAGWSFRLMQEAQHSFSAVFLTLTYADEHLTYGDTWPTLVKRDFQLFMKRLRKEHHKKSDKKLVYYACGEYGESTYRPHYHAILFNLRPDMLFDARLSEIWKLGNVRVDPCNIKTIQYVSKYVMKSDKKPDDVEPEFSLMSRGIGKGYLTDAVKKYYKQNQLPYVVWKDGQKMTMPRYYKERIFSEEELRAFGKQALEGIKAENLDPKKVQEINQMNYKQQLKRHEKRNKI